MLKFLHYTEMLWAFCKKSVSIVFLENNYVFFFPWHFQIQKTAQNNWQSSQMNLTLILEHCFLTNKNLENYMLHLLTTHSSIIVSAYNMSINYFLLCFGMDFYVMIPFLMSLTMLSNFHFHLFLWNLGTRLN